MPGAFDITILWTVINDTYTALKDRSGKKKDNIIEAHRAINSAFIQTYDYLRNKNGEYVPKPELAEVWNTASSAVMKVDANLGHMLYSKSRFWLDPDFYISLGREDEVIELNRLVDEMERLRNKIR